MFQRDRFDVTGPGRHHSCVQLHFYKKGCHGKIHFNQCESLQKHLFEPFFSSESRSSGLGLYICRQLCERHEAQISYRLDERHGQNGNAFVLYVRADFSGQAATGFDSTLL